MHEGSRDEGADDEAVAAEVPGHHEGSLDEPLDRRGLIAVAVLVIVGTVVMATRHGGGQSRAAEPTARPRPDVILVAVDGLGAEDVSSRRTPFLEGFKAESVVYRDAYAPSPWASEALRGLLTGQHRPVDRRTEGWVPGIADELQRVGYRTALVPGHVRHALGAGEESAVPTGYAEVLTVAGLEDPAGAEGSSVAAAALDWLGRSERPCLLVVTLADPRAPHHHYQGGSGGPDPSYEGPVESGLDHDDLLRLGPDLDAADRAQLAALHATEVAAADAFVHQLIEGARAHRDVAPVIVIAGLRRPALGEAGRFGLVPSMEPEDLRVPLWLHVPAAQAGTPALRGVVGAPVSLLDVGPTLLCALGLAPRAGLDGSSIYPGSAVPERPIRAVTSRGICAAVGFDGDRAVILEAEPPAALVRTRGAEGGSEEGGRWTPSKSVTGADADLRLGLARWMKRAGIEVPGGGVPDLEAAPFTP